MKKVFLLIMMTIMMISCQEEEVISSEKSITTKEIYLEEEKEEVGMLSFKSSDELYSFVENNEGADLLELAKKYSEKGIYNPLLLAYASEKEDVPVVNTQSSLLLLLLNEDGEIGIEDKIFRIDGDFVYTYTANDDGEGAETIANFLKEYNAGGIKLKEGGTIEYDNITVFRHENGVEKTGKSAKAFNVNTTSINTTTTLRGVGADEYWFFISFVWFSTNVEYNSILPGFLNMFLNAATSQNRLNYDVGIETDYVLAPWQPASTNYYGDDAYATTRVLWRLPKLSIGIPAPERYTITLGGSLHETYWGTSPTGSNHDVFLSY